MITEDEYYKTLSVHYCESYFEIDAPEDEPLKKNEGNAEIEIYADYKPTDADVEEALQIGGYLVAGHSGRLIREKITLDY